MQDTVETQAEGLAEQILIEDEKLRAQELVTSSKTFLSCVVSFANCNYQQDVFNIAPKRPNWDLKREMEKKLAKLERRTQEAIHTLIRQSYHSV